MEKNRIGTMLKKAAEMSIKTAADSRCMYCFHQPKMPDRLKEGKQKEERVSR